MKKEFTTNQYGNIIGVYTWENNKIVLSVNYYYNDNGLTFYIVSDRVTSTMYDCNGKIINTMKL